MELLHVFLNLVFPPTAFIALLLIWPVVAFAKTVYWFAHLLSREQLRGKVVAITGASSGIGEHIAYQYAKRGAKLVLAARRETRLEEVAERAKHLGASDVTVVRADVTKEEDCKNIIDEAINHFGRLDHLVLNAGIAKIFFLGDAEDTDGFRPIVDSLFWGSVYPTYYGLPYLRLSRGRIVVVASMASVLHYPRQTLYNAAKAAVFQFFDSLRVEERDKIGITIATPGWVESELTQGKLSDAPNRRATRDAQIGPFPVLGTEECAKAIVSAAERRMRYVVVPFWYIAFLPYRVFAPEILDWLYETIFLSRGTGPPLSQTIVEKTHVAKYLYPESMQKME